MKEAKANQQMKRLNTLALFLQRWELIEQMHHGLQTYYSDDANCTIRHFHWVFKPFPRVFVGQWHWNDIGVPYSIANPTLNYLESARRFLDLTPDEFFALFVPGYGFEPCGFKPLREDSRPGTIAHRIYHFMVYKQKQNALKLINK